MKTYGSTRYSVTTPSDARFFVHNLQVSEVREVLAKADPEGQIEVRFSTMSASTMFWHWAEIGLIDGIDPDAESRDRLRRMDRLADGSLFTDWWTRARASAVHYTAVTLTFPHPAGRVVGVAKRQDETGLPLFLPVLGQEDRWTEDLRSGFSFDHCDGCGIRHARRVVYLVEEANETLRCYGGSCASKRGLPQAVAQATKAIRKAFKGLRTYFGYAEGMVLPYSYEPVSLTAAVLAVLEADGTYHKASRGAASTKERTAAVMTWDFDGDRDSLDFIEACARRARSADLLARAEHVYCAALVRLDERMEKEGPSSFLSNVTVALHTASRSALGLFCWAIWDALKAPAAPEPWSGPYEPAAVPSTYGELVCYVDAHDAWQALGFDRSKIGAKPSERPLTKADTKRVLRFIPGEWTVLSIREFSSDYGPVSHVRLKRTDGSLLYWRASGSSDFIGLSQHDVLSSLFGTLGEVRPPRVYQGKTYQDGRQVSRLSFSKVSV